MERSKLATVESLLATVIIPAMDYRLFAKKLAHAGLTIRGFASLLHMNPNSITNYARNGVVPVHLGAIASLIAAMSDRQVDFRKVLADMPKRERRGRGVPFGHPRRMATLGAPRAPEPAKTPETPEATGTPKPRFWYPRDLELPVAQSQAPARTEPIQAKSKIVTITTRKRRSLGR